MRVCTVVNIIEFFLISTSVQAVNLRFSNGTVYSPDEPIAVKETDVVVLPAETPADKAFAADVPIAVKETDEVILPAETPADKALAADLPVAVKEIEPVVLPSKAEEVGAIVLNGTDYDMFEDIPAVTASSELSKPTVLNVTFSEPTPIAPAEVTPPKPPADEVGPPKPPADVVSPPKPPADTTPETPAEYSAETPADAITAETPAETTTTDETPKAPAASTGDMTIPEANQPAPPQESSGCGKGCIAAAVVCPIVGVFAIIGIALFIRRRRRRRRAEYDTAEAFDPVF